MQDFRIAMPKVLDKHTRGSNLSGAGTGRLIEAWQQLVENCEAGYELDTSEFANDAFSRIVLERVIADPDVRTCEELKPIIAEVKQLDTRMLQTTMKEDFQKLQQQNNFSKL